MIPWLPQSKHLVRMGGNVVKLGGKGRASEGLV